MKGRRIEATDVALGIGALLLALPVVVAPTPPMTDLPMHEAILALLGHHGEAGWSPPDLYATNLGHPNQLFYFVAYPLTYLVSVAMACKLVVAATLAFGVFAIARLARHRGANRLVALALAPVLVGWLFYYGFIGNLLGLGLLAAALPTLDEAVATPSARHVTIAAAWLVALQLAHQADLLAAGAVLALFALLHPMDRRTPRRLVPAAIGGALTVLEVVRTSHAGTPFARLFSQQVVFQPLRTKLTTLPSVVVGDVGPVAIVLLLLPFAAVALGLASRRTRSRETGPREPLRARLVRHRFGLAAALLAALYAGMPYSVNFGFFLHARFIAPAVVLAVVSGAAAFPVAASLRRVFVVACAAAPVATMLVAWPEYVEAGRQAARLDELIPAISRESAVAIFQLGAEPQHPFLVVAQANRVLAERGGRLLFSFAEYPISPIVYGRGHAWDGVLSRTYIHTADVRPAFDLRFFRYVLLHASDPRVMVGAVHGFAPEAHAIAAAGEWVLLESTSPTVPLTAPEAPLPDPPPATLAERLK